MPRRGSGGLNDTAKYARITVYLGNFRQYQPDPSETPTANNQPCTMMLSPSEDHAGHVTAFRTFEQPSGVKLWQRHDYTYGSSRRSLRPIVTEESDLNWMEWEYRSRQSRRNWVRKPKTAVSNAA